MVEQIQTNKNIHVTTETKCAPDARDHLSGGDTLYEDGELRKAREEYFNALECQEFSKPERSEVLRKIGRSYGIADKNYNKAIEFFQKSININSNNDHARQDLALYYKINRDFEGYIRELRSCNKINEERLEQAEKETEYYNTITQMMKDAKVDIKNYSQVIDFLSKGSFKDVMMKLRMYTYSYLSFIAETEKEDFFKSGEKLFKDSAGDCNDYRGFILEVLSRTSFLKDTEIYSGSFTNHNLRCNIEIGKKADKGHAFIIIKYNNAYYTADNFGIYKIGYDKASIGEVINYIANSSFEDADFFAWASDIVSHVIPRKTFRRTSNKWSIAVYQDFTTTKFSNSTEATFIVLKNNLYTRETKPITETGEIEINGTKFKIDNVIEESRKYHIDKNRLRRDIDAKIINNYIYGTPISL